MRWQDKMDAVIKDILGIEYTLIIDTNKSFTIFENNQNILTHSSLFDLEFHWKMEVGNALRIFFNEKIKNSLLKY